MKVMKRVKVGSGGVPLEEWEQEQLFIWAENNMSRIPLLRMLHASLNGVRLTPGARVKAKKQGMKAGVFDVSLPVVSPWKGPQSGRIYYGLEIEMKRQKGGRVSSEQKQWKEDYEKQGRRAVVCKGWLEARDEILNYLGVE